MKTIFIARAEISALLPSKEKDGKPVKATIDPGTPVTDALAKKFGLKAEDLAALVARGHIVERSAHVVTEAGDSPTALEVAAANKRAEDAEAALAAETKRADDAEAQVTTLTEQLAEATKPAAPAKA